MGDLDMMRHIPWLVLKRPLLKETVDFEEAWCELNPRKQELFVNDSPIAAMQRMGPLVRQ